jgi:hypothetical protein
MTTPVPHNPLAEWGRRSTLSPLKRAASPPRASAAASALSHTGTARSPVRRNRQRLDLVERHRGVVTVGGAVETGDA